MGQTRVLLVGEDPSFAQELLDMAPWEEQDYYVATVSSLGHALAEAGHLKPQIMVVEFQPYREDFCASLEQLTRLDERMHLLLIARPEDREAAIACLPYGVSHLFFRGELNGAWLQHTLRELAAERTRDYHLARLTVCQAVRGMVEGYRISEEEMVQLRQDAALMGESFVFMVLKMDLPFPVMEMREGKALRTGAHSVWRDVALPEELNCVDIMPLAGGRRWGMLLAAPASMSQHQMGEMLYAVAFTLQREFLRETGRTLSILIPTAISDLEELPNLYRAMEQYMEYMVFYGREKVLRLRDIQATIYDSKSDYKDLLVQVRKELTALNLTDVRSDIDLLFSSNVTRHYNLADFQDICRKLIVIFEQFRLQQDMPSYEDLLGQNKLDLEQWYTAESIHRWFISEAENLITQVRSVQGAGYSRKVQEAIRYIRLHYSQEITVDSIANALSLSGGHLRSIFKEETGSTLIEYLTNYRMEQAKEMLDSGNYKIYEVADRVGYKTSQYFSQVFKRVTGLSPQEYLRGDHMNHEDSPNLA